MKGIDKDSVKDIVIKLAFFKWMLVFFLILLIFIINAIVIHYSIPKEITIATGDPYGSYHRLGKIYKKALEEKKIKVNLINTEGSIENFNLLRQGKVDVAFLQNSLIVNNSEYYNLKGLASLYHEPVFLFHRKDKRLNLLSDLREKRVYLGAIESGAHSLSLELLEKNGLTEYSIKPYYYSYKEAKDALIKNEIDAGFFILNYNNEIVKTLIKNKDIDIFNFTDYKAYQIYLPKLSSIIIPKNYYDKHIPKEDISLLSPLATLVCQENFHPKLAEMLLIVIDDLKNEINKDSNFLSNKEKFPSSNYVDFELHDAAKNYFEKNSSLISKYFSYDIIFFLSQLKYLLLFIIIFVVIIINILPFIYDFQIGLLLKSKYKKLRKLEDLINTIQTIAELENIKNNLDLLNDEVEIESSRIPEQFQRKINSWKLHYSMVNDILRCKQKELGYFS